MMLTKWFVRQVGKLSDGMSLCFKEGLTSGKMLDYVYRNTPSGKTFLGKQLDKAFLNHPGWVAIRFRRLNLESLLTEALQEKTGVVRLIDIASGPADYILSVLEKSGNGRIEAICQDLDARWLEEGRQNAATRGIKNITFRIGNAFDTKSLVGFQPHIVV